MSKKSKIARFLLWTFWVTIFNGCSPVYFKTVPLPVNKITLNEYLTKKPIWTIADANHKTEMISSVRIRGDSIFGKLSYLGYVDHPDRPSYRKQKGPQSKSYLHLYTNSSEFSDIVKISLSDITSATTHENAVKKTILVNAAMGAAVAGAFYIPILIACNCPYVKVIGADTTTFQGSLFPGAISKSFERQDNLIMKAVPLDQAGKINVRISNELPEIEYFNQVELFEVRDMPYGSLGQHALGHPVSYFSQNNLISASTLGNKNIKEEVQSIQGGFYDFNEQGNDYELNKVFLTFDKAKLKDEAILIIRAKQSKWMETVAAFTLQQFGTAYNSWVERLDKADPKKYDQSAIDRGISMNAYIKRNDQWDYIGSYANVGTLAYRDLALNVHLSNINTENIEIKLESAHGFWDIDYVGITDEWSEKVSLAKLNTISAVNREGVKVMQATATDDDTYTELPAEGDFINIHFEAPNDPNSYFILKGKGYYHPERKYTSKPNYKFLKAVKQDKMTSNQLSRLLQRQLDVAARKNK